MLRSLARRPAVRSASRENSSGTGIWKIRHSTLTFGKFGKILFAELKRRNVYKVAVAYGVAGWALAQGIAQVFPVFGVPNWIIQLIVLLIVIGFPIALVSGVGV